MRGIIVQVEMPVRTVYRWWNWTPQWWRRRRTAQAQRRRQAEAYTRTLSIAP